MELLARAASSSGVTILNLPSILIHCAEYIQGRDQCFDVNTLGELFQTVSPDKLYTESWSLGFNLVELSVYESSQRSELYLFVYIFIFVFT